MYVCGLTVYNRGHIGNYRSLVASDLLRRTLRYKGYRVKEVINVTDVDDRIIQQAQAAGKTLTDFTAEHIRAFEEDMARLGIERPEVMPRATDHIPEMVDLVSRLTARGHTYTAEGSVYFRIASFPSYGRLSRLDAGAIQAGARVDTDKYDKENARDFVLWKAKEDEPAWAHWDAPFGRGRPGWHIECSAMSMKYLGETFDLHCGGEDLIFPHHENEIAQSEAGTGKPFVRHWVHVKHLMVDNETMSKSKGNFFLIPELLESGHSAESIRYLLASSHYRKPLNFTLRGAPRGGGRARADPARAGKPGKAGEGRAGGPAAPEHDRRRGSAEARVRRRPVGRPEYAGGARRRPRPRQRRIPPDRGGCCSLAKGRVSCAIRSPRWTPSSASSCRRRRGSADSGAAGALRRASGGAALAATSPARTRRAPAWRRWASCSRTRPRARCGGARR